jgi:hypothetical protein
VTLRWLVPYIPYNICPNSQKCSNYLNFRFQQTLDVTSINIRPELETALDMVSASIKIVTIEHLQETAGWMCWSGKWEWISCCISVSLYNPPWKKKYCTNPANTYNNTQTVLHLWSTKAVPNNSTCLNKIGNYIHSKIHHSLPIHISIILHALLISFVNFMIMLQPLIKNMYNSK